MQINRFGRPFRSSDLAVGTVIAERHCGIRHTITGVERLAADNGAIYAVMVTITPLDNPTLPSGRPLRDTITFRADGLYDDPENEARSAYEVVSARDAGLATDVWHRTMVAPSQ